MRPVRGAIHARVLRGPANNVTSLMASPEEAGTGDRDDRDNRIDVVLSGNGDMPPKCTSVLPINIYLSLLCQGKDNFRPAVRQWNQMAYIAGSSRR
jgi:hypothetical protein